MDVSKKRLREIPFLTIWIFLSTRFSFCFVSSSADQCGLFCCVVSQGKTIIQFKKSTVAYPKVLEPYFETLFFCFSQITSMKTSTCLMQTPCRKKGVSLYRELFKTMQYPESIYMLSSANRQLCKNTVQTNCPCSLKKGEGVIAPLI